MDNQPIHILLADDDESDRLLFIEAFEELEINTFVSTVNNGVQLMEVLNMENIKLPQLLFLDLNMPRKNGLECLKEIRNNKNLYSTSDSEKDVEETFLKGANIYITKPNSFKMLKQVLEKAVFTTIKYQEKIMDRENFLLRI
jgi:CheY-like chemotaxis protein